MNQTSRGFVSGTIEIKGEKMQLHYIGLTEVTVMRNNRLERFPISEVNAKDLSIARQKLNLP